MTPKFTYSERVRNYSSDINGLTPADHFKSTRPDHYRSHTKVLDHIKAGKGVSKELINEVLFTSPIVTDNHIALCDKLVAESVTVKLPFSNTPYSSEFTKLAGSAAPAQNALGKIPGCYYIFEKESGRSYVGHTVHLGKRVREHANSPAPITSLADWMTEMRAKDSGLVTLYRLTADYDHTGLTLVEMLCTLEMYLFLVHAPTENRTLVATPGVMQSPEANAKHAAKMNKILHVYKGGDDGGLIYLYRSPSSRGFCRDLGVGKTFVHNVMTRTEGWFRDTILLSFEDLLPNEVPTMTMEELKELHSNLSSTEAYKSRPQYVVTNTATGEVMRFPSYPRMRAAIGPHVPGSTKYRIERKLK
jgi:hypothetical protein